MHRKGWCKTQKNAMKKNEQIQIEIDAIQSKIEAAIKAKNGKEAKRLNELHFALVESLEPAPKKKSPGVNFARIVPRSHDAENALLIRAERMTMDY